MPSRNDFQKWGGKASRPSQAIEHLRLAARNFWGWFVEGVSLSD